MGNKINHADPMAPEEVMRRAEAFAPTPVEQFVSWATEVGECLAIPGCSCNGCATVAREVKAAKIMRLALEMIVRQTTFPDSFAAQIARRTAEQALRECGK